MRRKCDSSETFISAEQFIRKGRDLTLPVNPLEFLRLDHIRAVRSSIRHCFT